MQIQWFEGSVNEALDEYQKKNGILIVYIYADNENNSLKFDALWATLDLSILGNVPYIAIRLAKNSEGVRQFSEFFPTPVFPVCYILGLNAQPLEVMTTEIELTSERLNNSFVKALTLYQDQLKEKGLTLPNDGKTSSENDQNQNIKIFDSEPQSDTQDPASEMGKEEKLEYYKKILEEKRKADATKAQEEALQKEIQRRNDGKSVAEVREKQRDKELREAAEARRKQKEEDALLLKKLREQIRQDKEERANRSKEHVDSSSSSQKNENVPISTLSNINKPVNSDDCRIQARFPDGSNLNLTFPSKEPLKVLLDAINQDSRRPENFFLVQSFPRKKLTEFDKSFQEHNLTPSSVVLVISGKDGEGGSGKASLVPIGYLNMLFGFLYMPFAFLYRLLISTVNRNGIHNQPQKKKEAKGTQSTAKNEPMEKDGNFHRFRDESDHDNSDNEATWNGNSTQQL